MYVFIPFGPVQPPDLTRKSRNAAKRFNSRKKDSFFSTSVLFPPPPPKNRENKKFRSFHFLSPIKSREIKIVTRFEMGKISNVALIKLERKLIYRIAALFCNPRLESQNTELQRRTGNPTEKLSIFSHHSVINVRMYTLTTL